ncbi:MAG: CSLREA domain-containing protein [Nitrospira sp. BO4]|nr:CSLREA domain-containing protein [Nitrospira sp. BO4]
MTHEMKPSVGTFISGDLCFSLCVALVTGFCLLALPDNGTAATIVVNSLEDTVVSGDGACTLREAILNAEQDSHAGSTDCAAGSGADTVTFSVSGTSSSLSSSDLTITSAGGLTIDGGGKITISGISNFGITVGPAGVLTLKNLTFSNSSGISNAGTMTIDHCTVNSNSGLEFSSPFIESEQDGAIYNATGSTMTISHSTVRDNTASLPAFDRHGGIIDNHGTMTISTSTINGNQGICRCGRDLSFGGGGAIHNAPEGTLALSNSTVSDTLDPITVPLNGIYNEGALTVSHSTVSNNGTGIFNGGTLKLHSSLLADGCAAAGPYGPPAIPITSLGYNLDKTGTCGLTGPGDKANIDPRLDPAGLKDNGGPTKTLALCTGSGTPAGCTGKSPAIDAVPLAHCTGAEGQPLGLDQRAYFRPVEVHPHGTALCDSGAFEATSSPLLTLNNFVTFTTHPASSHTNRDTRGCPAGFVGKSRFALVVTNKPGSPPLSHLVAEVATLTKGNLVLNADGGLGGDGATVTFSPSGQYTDGVLTAKEHVGLPVTLCLKTFDQFTFFVDVLGTR